MAFSTQFALSYELSKIVPVNSIVNVASKGLLKLVRDFQDSGSNLVTEYDLAQILGRNYISPQFASTFRTGVKESRIYRLVGIAELVLEIGAGPTVDHALNEADYFPMMVQLSVLLWAHKVTPLALSLARTFELRNTDLEKSPPKYSDLVGTLRCIQQQTSGFLWELYFSAVDEILRVKLQLRVEREDRAISHAVLGTLLDALPAVQRFPEKYFLAIHTQAGITSLVVWIHNVLGLTVELQSDHDVAKFGKEVPRVSIDCRHHNCRLTDEVTLLNEAKDVAFKAATDPQDDPILEPNCRHTLEGFGLQYLEFLTEDESIAQELVLRFMKLFLEKAGATSGLENTMIISGSKSGLYCPSRERYLAAARVLFPIYEISESGLAKLDDVQARAGVEWYYDKSCPKTFEPNEGLVTMSLHRSRPLFDLLLAVSRINNLDECRLVPLNVRGMKKPMTKPSRDASYMIPMTMKQAFEILANLLLDQFAKPEELGRAVIVSCMGWSLCLGSILHQDPGDLHADLTIKRGVPARYKERKEWVMDHSFGRTWTHDLDLEDAAYSIAAAAGDTSQIGSFMKSSSTKYLIATDDSAFQVYTIFTCYNLPQATAYVRLGLRYMQDIYWEVATVPRCDHDPEMELDLDLEVPVGCVVFRGLLDVSKHEFGTLREIGKSSSLPTEDAACKVHISMSAGNISARWILLANLQVRLREYQDHFRGCIKTQESCIKCAIRYVQEQFTDKGHSVVLIT